MPDRKLTRHPLNDAVEIRSSGDEPPQVQPAPRRFIIDAHQHFDARPDYFQALVAAYRPRNAMACVLTPMAGFDATKKAAAAYPDVVIPYGQINVDDTAAPEQVDAFAEAGFRGIKMHSPQRNCP